MTATLTMATRYPLDRLKHRTHLTDEQLAKRVGVTDRTIRRLRDTGLTNLQADRYAVACGWHPSSIWTGWDGDRDVLA